MQSLSLRQDIAYLMHGLSESEKESFLLAVRPLTQNETDASQLVFANYGEFEAKFRSGLSSSQVFGWHNGSYSKVLDQARSFFDEVVSVAVTADGDLFYDLVGKGCDLYIGFSGPEVDAEFLFYEVQASAYWADDEHIVENMDAYVSQSQDLDFDLSLTPFEYLDHLNADGILTIMNQLQGFTLSENREILKRMQGMPVDIMMTQLDEAFSRAGGNCDRLDASNIDFEDLVVLHFVYPGLSDARIVEVVELFDTRLEWSIEVKNVRGAPTKVWASRAVPRSNTAIMAILVDLNGLSLGMIRQVGKAMADENRSQKVSVACQSYRTAEAGTLHPKYKISYTETMADHLAFATKLIQDRNQDGNPGNDIRHVQPEMLVAMILVESEGLSKVNDDGLLQFTETSNSFETFFDAYAEGIDPPLNRSKKDYRSSILAAAYYLEKDCFLKRLNQHQSFAVALANYNVGDGRLKKKWSPTCYDVVTEHGFDRKYHMRPLSKLPESGVNHIAKVFLARDYLF